MNHGGTALLLPLIIGLAIFALMGRRIMRPRRFTVASLLFAPALILFAIANFFAHRPMPSPGHTAGLAIALVVGAAAGWLRAKTVRIAIDPATGAMMQRGTPYGLLMLVALFVLRTGVRVVAIQHPELGIDLNQTTDILLFFALGILIGYAAELYLVAGRVRRAA